MDVFIVLSTIAAVAVVGLIVTNIVQLAPSVSIGEASIKSLFPTLKVEVPITISNPGPFEITNVNFKLSVEAEDKVQLLSGSLGPMSIPAGAKNVKATAIFTVDANKIPNATLLRLVSNPENLTVKAEFYTDMPPFIKILGTASASIPWGPPVYNLKLSEPKMTQYNATSMKIDVDVSFDNLSEWIPISGTGTITIFDSKGNSVGSGQLAIDVSPKGKFNKTLSMLVGIPVEQLSTLLFNDTVLSYRAVAEFKSYDVSVFTMERSFSFSWGAPLYNLQVGPLTFDFGNSTHIKAISGLSFYNKNDFISINTQVNVKIINSSSGREVGSGTISINAPARSHFSDTIVGFIDISALPVDTLLFNDETLNFKVIFSGVYSGIPFQLDRDLNVNWGAPLKDFAIGSLSISGFGESSINVSVPLSFVNHASWIDIVAPLTIKVYNATSGVLMGTSVIQVSAPALSTFSQTFPVSLGISMGALDSLMFYDSVQNFKVALSGSFSGLNFNTSKSLSYNWGAPIKNAQLGLPTIQIYNLTHVKVLLPINFTNNSDFFTISGTLAPSVLDANLNVVGEGESVTISVAPKTFYSTNLIVYIHANYLEALLEKELTLQLTFNTAYGTVQRRLSINA